MSPLYKPMIINGDHLSGAHGGCFQSCLVAMCFSPTTSNPKTVLGQYRNVLEVLAEALQETNGGIMSTSSSTSNMIVSVYLPVPVTAASFFTSKLSKKLDSPTTLVKHVNPAAAAAVATAHYPLQKQLTDPRRSTLANTRLSPRPVPKRERHTATLNK